MSNEFLGVFSVLFSVLFLVVTTSEDRIYTKYVFFVDGCPFVGGLLS